IQPVLRGWLNLLDGLQREYEIIVADLTGAQETVERANELASLHPKIRVVQQSQPAGVGAALRTAIGAARYPLLLYAGARWPDAKQSLRNCLESIDKVDLVSIYRERKPRRRWPRWNEALYQLLARLL